MCLCTTLFIVLLFCYVPNGLWAKRYFNIFLALFCHLPSLVLACCALCSRNTQPPRTALTHDFKVGVRSADCCDRWYDECWAFDGSRQLARVAHRQLRSSEWHTAASHHARHSLITHDFQGEYDQVDCCLLRSLIWALSLRWLTTARIHRQLANSSLACRCLSRLAELVDSSRSLSVARGACWQLVYA
jgi:hypothetical protein